MNKQNGFIDGGLLARMFLWGVILTLIGSIATWELLKWLYPFVKSFIHGVTV